MTDPTIRPADFGSPQAAINGLSCEELRLLANGLLATLVSHPAGVLCMAAARQIVETGSSGDSVPKNSARAEELKFAIEWLHNTTKASQDARLSTN